MTRAALGLVRIDSSLLLELVSCALLAVLVQAYAGANLRGAYADGAWVSNQILAHQLFLNAGRLVSEGIGQFPVLVAIHLGLEAPHSAALVYSISTNVLPGVLILLCLPALPENDRGFFIFPLFVYFAGTLSAQFASNCEGLIAASYFWLLLFLILFGNLTILRLALILVLAIGSIRLNEVMLFLGPILFTSCAIRLREQKRPIPRVTLSVVALCVLAGTVVAAIYALDPVSISNRDGFIAGLFSFHWLYTSSKGGGLNLPCLLGFGAVGCMCLATFRHVWGPAAAWIFAAISIPLAIGSFWLDWLTNPTAQFSARYNAALLSVPASALLMFIRARPAGADATITRPVSYIVILLGISVSLWHVSATAKWCTFLTHFSDTLRSRTGVIPWDAVTAANTARESKLSMMMVWGWTNPDLSLVAIGRSCVTSIIDNPSWVTGFQPYAVADAASMPAIRGIVYVYLMRPDAQRAACVAAGAVQ